VTAGKSERLAMAEDQRAELGPISLVIIQANTLCNLNCTYCYLPGRSKNSQMHAGLVEAIATELAASNLCLPHITVVWHAGEPTLVDPAFYEQAFATFERILGHKVRVTHSFQTNATLLNERWCDLFLAHGVRVGVSIDGPQFLHDLHRRNWSRRGSFDAAVRGLKLLQAAGLRPGAIAVISAATLSHVEDFHKFFVDEKVDWLGLNVEEIEGSHADSSLLIPQLLAPWTEFVRRLFDLSRKSGLRVREFEAIEKLIRTRGRVFDDQVHPYSILSFDHLGRFTTFSPELLSMSWKDGSCVLGNILTDDLKGAGDSPRLRLLWQEVARGVTRCRDSCSYFTLCGGGAPSNKLAEHGRFDVAETLYCRFKKQAMIDAVLSSYEDMIGLS
jgi:uncharacterized protein